jgi:hypothetical protein
MERKIGRNEGAAWLLGCCLALDSVQNPPLPLLYFDKALYLPHEDTAYIEGDSSAGIPLGD